MTILANPFALKEQVLRDALKTNRFDAGLTNQLQSLDMALRAGGGKTEVIIGQWARTNNVPEPELRRIANAIYNEGAGAKLLLTQPPLVSATARKLSSQVLLAAACSGPQPCR